MFGHGYYGSGYYGSGYWGPGVSAPAPVVAPTAQTPAGRGKAQKRIQFTVKVDGEWLLFSDLDELIAFLDRREEAELERAEAKAEKDARRIISRGKAAAPAKEARPPQVALSARSSEISEYIADLQAKIERVYWKKVAEIVAAEAEEIDDINAIVGML